MNKQADLGKMAVALERHKAADTILQQLGGTKFLAMTGAKHLTVTETPGLSLRLPYRNKSLPNYVRVVLRPGDYYEVTFAVIRGNKLKPLSNHTQIYAEDLRRLFESETQLYTTL
jgi:hypothetical protein